MFLKQLTAFNLHLLNNIFNFCSMFSYLLSIYKSFILHIFNKMFAILLKKQIQYGIDSKCISKDIL